MDKKQLETKWKKTLSAASEADPNIKVKVDTWYKDIKPVRLDESAGVIYCINSQGKNGFIENLAVKNFGLLVPFFKESFSSDKNFTLKINGDEKENTVPESGDEFEEFDNEEYLNPRYVFENFITGPNNRLAMAACLAISDSYVKDYNPLFLYGGSGLGKTHLLQAIVQYVKKNYPEKKILYISSEVFTNDLIQYLREKKNMEEFRNKYRHLDMLLIDDIQFVAGKDQTEEEIFSTFEALHNAGKQVVFSSDRPPAELGDMPKRLTSRFSWGMVADIQPPDYETRVAILIQKAEQDGYNIDKDMREAIEAIAKKIPSNIRELEGAFTRVIFQGAALNEKITKDMARRVLTDVFKVKSQEITPENIKKAVSEYFGIKVSEMESPNRSRSIAYPRQLAIYLMRTMTNYSLIKIGEEFGGRDHTTILHSYEKIESDIKKSDELRNTIENIKSQLSEA